MSIIPLSQEVANAAVSQAIAPMVRQAVAAGTRARTAGTAARVTLDTMAAARRIQRMFRRQAARRSAIHQKNRGFWKVAENPGTSTAKKERTTTSDPTNYFSRVLHFLDLTDIDKASALLEINRRQRHNVLVTGVSIKEIIRNLNTSNPMVYNFAIISQKNSKTFDGTGFFRDFDSSRDIDFNLTLLNSMKMNNLPISTDKFNVHFRKKVVLAASDQASAGYLDSTSNSYKYWEKYIPINRNFRFNDDGTTECETPLYAVWWCDLIQNGAGAGSGANQITKQVHHVVHFKEPAASPYFKGSTY